MSTYFCGESSWQRTRLPMQAAVLLRLASRLVFQTPVTLLVCSEKLWERVHQDLEQKSTCIGGTMDNTCHAYGCLCWAEYRSRQFRSRERTRAPLCAGSQWISKIDDDVALSPEAADQRIALGWRFHRFGPVPDSAVDESSLASVTNPGPACPPHRHIARLGKFEEALEGRRPADISGRSAMPGVIGGAEPNPLPANCGRACPSSRRSSSTPRRHRHDRVRDGPRRPRYHIPR
jgi:hypothetical protein